MHRFHTTPLRSYALALALLGLACAASAQATSTLRIQPTGGVWSSGSGFQFDLKKKKALATRASR